MWTVWDLKPHRKEGGISGSTRETGRSPAKNLVAGQAVMWVVEDKSTNLPTFFFISGGRALTLRCRLEKNVK